SKEFDGDLSDLVNETVDIREIDSRGWPEHFFEVELRRIVRHRNDCLLNPDAIGTYLSQVAPVPFSSQFRFGEQIEEMLSRDVALTSLELTIDGIESPVSRPHRNSFEISDGINDEFTELQVIDVPALDGRTAARGWILHHAYKGAI